MAETDRAQYGVNENEMKFKKEITGGKLFDDVADDFDSIVQNPINLTLSTFEKEFMKNERVTYDSFLQLQVDLQKFYDLLDQQPHYELMDIVKLFKDILFKYKMFCTFLRQSILLSETKMTEAKDIVKTKYITLDNLSMFKQEMLQTVQDLKEEGDLTEIKKYGDSVVAFIPAELKEKYRTGTKVIVKPAPVSILNR